MLFLESLHHFIPSEIITVNILMYTFLDLSRIHIFYLFLFWRIYIFQKVYFLFAFIFVVGKLMLYILHCNLLFSVWQCILDIFPCLYMSASFKEIECRSFSYLWSSETWGFYDSLWTKFPKSSSLFAQSDRRTVRVPNS